MEKKGWKNLAIIFIILFILSVAYISWITYLGYKMLNQETECSFNVCADDEYDAYYFDAWEKVCYCYKDGEVAYSEFIK